MPGAEEPLLARPPSSLNSSNALAEEDALLTGHSTTKHPSRWQRIFKLIEYTWLILSTSLVFGLLIFFYQAGTFSTPTNDSTKPTGKRNLIFMVSDGMGPSSVAMTRSFRQFRDGLPYGAALTIDNHIIGQSRTRSTSSLITDSAAGATAFSCGLKSYNGAISTLPDHSPCGTVMEAAKKAGYTTGLVVTTRITDATPACFAAHVNKREEEDRIAEQLLGDYPLGRTVDLIMGAGRCHFLPNGSEGGCRADEKDLVQEAKEKGYQYINNRAGFDGLNVGSEVKLPLLGLFADVEIPYELDRQQQDDVYPSLQEMAETALNALSAATKDSEQGFFLMIEGSRIDHTLHANDPAATVHEIMAFDRTFQAVLDFIERDDVQGVVISTSDHDTGGIATAHQADPYIYPEYAWYPSILLNASHSSEWLAADYAKYLSSTSSSPDQPLSPRVDATLSSPIIHRSAKTYLRAAIPAHLGIHDVSDAEIEEITSHDIIFAPWLFAGLVARRSGIGYSTHGHSGADVNIYSNDPAAAGVLRGNVENTEVGVFLRNYLDVDVQEITDELLKSGTGAAGHENGEGEEGGEGGQRYFEWMGQKPEQGERLDGQAHLDVDVDLNARGAHDHRTRVRCEVCGLAGRGL